MRIKAMLVACALFACGHHHVGNTVDGAGGGGGGGGDSGGMSDGNTGNGDAGNDSTGPRQFGVHSLIIPMDLSYQSSGMFQAYGLVYQLLAHNIRVYWLIDPNKTYHAD